MGVTVAISKDLSGIERRLGSSSLRRARLRLAERSLKDANVHCPKRTGALMASAVVADGGAKLMWPMRYAQKVYYGSRVLTTINPQARTHWFEVAKGEHIEDWVKVVEEALA